MLAMVVSWRVLRGSLRMLLMLHAHMEIMTARDRRFGVGGKSGVFKFCVTYSSQDCMLSYRSGCGRC